MTPDGSSTASPYDLSRFSLGDMTRCGSALRRLSAGATSMEEVAQRTVRHLYEQMRDESRTERACALVRTFITLPFEALQPQQQSFAASMMENTPAPSMKCLTLLASAGDDPDWNSRQTSAGHQALPLPSPEAVARSPMIAQLMRQLGVQLTTLLAADSTLVLDQEQHTFNVFHVAEAVGSPHIPAQSEFVVPRRIRSVLGFGGLLPPGELFATILFSRTLVAREAADMFRPLALNVKVAMLPFAGRRVFS